MRRRSFMLALIVLLGCGDDGSVSDAGVDAEPDAGEADAGSMDAGLDAGVDAATSDDAGMPYVSAGALEIELAARGDTTDEAGSLSFEVWVRLSANPGALVDMGVFAEDEGEVVVDPPRLRFSTRNWEEPQRIAVRGVDDDVVDGDIITSLSVWSRSASADFSGEASAVVPVTNLDDESALEAVEEIAVGTDHVCAVAGGVVYCWGDGTRAQLGGVPESLLPIAIADIDDAFAVSAGDGFTCVARGSDPTTGGTVSCWGVGSAGQLGDGMSVDHATPAAVTGLTDIIALDSGGDFTCALHATGIVSCWGSGSDGRLGDGSETTRASPVEVMNLEDASAVAASDHGACALRGTGGVRCWGRNDQGQARGQSGEAALTPTNIAGLARMVALSAGGDSYCALRDDNAVRCWGENDRNQLGDLSGESSAVRGEATTPRSEHAQVLTLGSGDDHHCLFSNTGELVCWGEAEGTAIGTGDTALYMPEGFVRHDARAYASLRSTPTQIAGRGALTCLLIDGRVACMGPAEATILRADGWTDEGARTETPTFPRPRFDSLASTPLTTCAVSSIRESRCWGGDHAPGAYDGAQGNGHLVPVTVPGDPVRVSEDLRRGSPSWMTASSLGFAMTVFHQDEVRVYGAMGRPLVGGSDAIVYGGISTDRQTRIVGPDASAELALGDEHLCWLEEATSPHCYGLDDRGQLGDDDAFDSPLSSRSTGTPVAGVSEARAVAAGANHACAIQLADDALFCWGGNEHGQLGAGDTADHPLAQAPTRLPASADDVSAGGNTTCAFVAGVMTCVGDLGDGENAEGRVFGVENIDGVELGKDADHPTGCARADGVLHCWGVLGGTWNAPATVGENVELFAVGRAHVCWADPDHLRCSGSPAHGVLGGYDLLGLRYVGAPE